MDSEKNNPLSGLANDILNRVETLVLTAETESKPLEVDPARSQLFELFVSADASGFLEEDATIDLSAEGLCKELAQRWNLAETAQQSIDANKQLPNDHVSRMRLLWSVMRMWMEWNYAWNRWREFHNEDGHVDINEVR